MDWKRYGRLALIGVGACVAIMVVMLVIIAIGDALGGSDKRDTGQKLDVKVVADNAKFYAAAVLLPASADDETCRKAAKAVADRSFDGRYGQVQVFDDEWARSMVLPENRGTELSAEEEARWEQHLRMTYVHNAKGYWYDR